MIPPPPSDHAIAFAAHLVKLEKRPGAMPALRRSLPLEPGTFAPAYPFVIPWLGQRSSPWSDAVHYAVAAMWAHHPCRWSDAKLEDPEVITNMGASLHILIGSGARAAERRATAILDAERDLVLDQLRLVLPSLREAVVPVDWAQLLDDLLHWGRWRQYRWARAIWTPIPTDPAEEAVDALR